MPCHKTEIVNLPPLEAVVRGHAGRGSKRLTQLKKENARPKKLLTEADLEHGILLELLEVNYWDWNKRTGLWAPCAPCSW